MKKPVRIRLGLFLTTIVVLVGLSITSCSSTIPRRDPMGEVFPSVAGDPQRFDLLAWDPRQPAPAQLARPRAITSASLDAFALAPRSAERVRQLE